MPRQVPQQHALDAQQLSVDGLCGLEAVDLGARQLRYKHVKKTTEMNTRRYVFFFVLVMREK